MSRIEKGLQEGLVAERKKRQRAEEKLRLFTLGDKAQKIAVGAIKSFDEYNELGFRLDGEPSSRTVLTKETIKGQSLLDVINGMPSYELQLTENIEKLLTLFSVEQVIKELSRYDLDGFLKA